MQLVIPCDWKVVDLLKTKDANDFGEALRGLCFVGTSQDTGCYSTFDVQKCFTKVTEGEIFEEAKKHLYEDIKPTVYHYKLEEKDCYMKYVEMGNGEIVKSKICEPEEIVMGWTWDGDGCLYFRFNGRKVVNTDCKKDYNWRWIE
jgi:hypothetical protein